MRGSTSQTRSATRRPFIRWAVLGYLLLLAASHISRQFLPDARPAPDQRISRIPAMRADQPDSSLLVTLAYRFDAENPVDPANGGRLPLVLLHGSPVASSSMEGLRTALRSYARPTLTPDLPGFGGSSIRVPDYSVRAHGAYLTAWLDSLSIPKVHLIAYSMAGGVVLESYRLDPTRIASITMLSAIGVQELELTGDYYLNHAVHAVQLAALWGLRELFPHFGYLDDAILGVPYGRNFYDTDQRRLRGIFQEVDVPMLILHGEDDFLVPVAAALEHQRLVPQSRIELFPEGEGGHGLVFVRPDTLAYLIANFVDDAESGRAPRRGEADPERLRRASAPLDANSLPSPGAFSTVFLMILVGVASWISEDLATIGAGLMAARGTFTFSIAVAAALLGIVMGDVGLYLAGRWIGRPVVERAPFSWFIKPEDLERGAAWFDEKGIRAIIISRFVPGTRLPTYVTAGVIKAPFGTFLLYFLVAALLWTPALVGISMLAGQRVLEYYDLFERFAIWVLGALILTLLVATRFVPLMFSHKGRRRLYGRWLRMRRWEFWPPWLFYSPVLAWWLWLSIRHRSFTAFTAANPAMPDGGFVGESKSDILRRLAHAPVARWELIPAGGDPNERLQTLVGFMAREGLSWPLVLKPDVGERGRGVTIARSEEEAKNHLGADPSATIVQEYVAGKEYGVFYVRHPGDSEGRIISITDKRFPEVTGDGINSLETLILDDSRGVCMADLHMSAHRRSLSRVLESGERYRLTELGTHCRGSLFLDGQEMMSESLSSAIDSIAKGYPGFFFGRFDIRGEHIEHIRAGHGFRIIELNGVTSESTHIYQPGTSLRKAYKALFVQWSLAYEIGLENMRRGHAPSGISSLARTLLERIRKRS